MFGSNHLFVRLSMDLEAVHLEKPASKPTQFQEGYKSRVFFGGPQYKPKNILNELTGRGLTARALSLEAHEPRQGLFLETN